MCTLLTAIARNSDIFTLLTNTTDAHDVREVYLRNPLISGERLRTLSLPGNLSVLAIGRSGEMLVPHGNTRLELGDHLTLFGELTDIKAAVDLLERKPVR